MKALFASCLLLPIFLLAACSPSQEVTSFWKNPEKSPNRPYKSVFIAVLAQDRAAKTTLESDLADVAESFGLKATKSGEVFQQTFTKEGMPSKEEMLTKIRALGCDAIFTVSLLDVRSEQRYVPGNTAYAGAYAPYPYYGYYGGFYGYYVSVYPVVTAPGYYTNDKRYFIEGNLYDAATEKIQWSMQSSAYNPSSLSSFSRGYAKLLVETLRQN